MAQRPTGDIDHTVNSLADLKLEGETLDSLADHVDRLGVQSMDGWDAAAISLVTGHEIATYGSTDDRVNPVDQVQYDAKKGPCIDAITTGESQYFDGTSIEPRWRQFAETAGDNGVYSVLSFPMTLDGEVIGALNFYSRERDAIRPGNKEEGSVFAAQAAVAVANARALMAKDMHVSQLEEGLQSRTMIGQATGLLMAQEGLTSDEAFQKLVHVSQTSNIKLRDIAQRYVEEWEQRAAPQQAG